MSRLRVQGDGGRETDHPPSDFWFNPWLVCIGSRLKAEVDKVAERYIQANLKVRAPKAAQIERVGAIASTLIANLFRFHREAHEADRIAVPTEHAKVTRYQREGFQQIGKIVDFMATEGLIQKFPAHSHKRRTGIAAEGELRAMLVDPVFGHQHGDVRELEGRETIILRARTGRRIEGRQESELVDYEDTPETHRMRGEVVAINTFLLRQCIALGGVQQGNVTLTRRFLITSRKQPQRFDLHGRLYGAFWLNLPKEQRVGLRINGEPVADLDFASMFPRLAYLHVGSEPPAGDLYDVPGLENHRAGVKAGLSALLSTETDAKRLAPEVREKLPESWTAALLRDAIASKHPLLVPLFGQGMALSFMFAESRIMLATLLSLKERDIPALPMHDGLMTPASRVGEATEAMQWASTAVTGTALPVERKA